MDLQRPARVQVPSRFHADVAIRSGFSQRDKVGQSGLQADERGEDVSQTDVPKMLFDASHKPNRFNKPLPACFDCGYIGLRQDLADIFAAADLGRGGLYDVTLMKADKFTPMGTTVKMRNISNARATIDPGVNGLKRFMDGKELYELPYDLTKNASDLLALAGPADGRGVWAHSKIYGCFFLTDRLGKPLRRHDCPRL